MPSLHTHPFNRSKLPIVMRNGKRRAQDPPVIYLPSSGGFGGLRIVPEVSNSLKEARPLLN
jgi:hypothetical protein